MKSPYLRVVGCRLQKDVFHSQRAVSVIDRANKGFTSSLVLFYLTENTERIGMLEDSAFALALANSKCELNVYRGDMDHLEGPTLPSIHPSISTDLAR